MSSLRVWSLYRWVCIKELRQSDDITCDGSDYEWALSARGGIQTTNINRVLQACVQIPDTVEWSLQLLGYGPNLAILESVVCERRIADYFIRSVWQNGRWSVIETILAYSSGHEELGILMVEDRINGWLTDRNDESCAKQLCRVAIREISLPERNLAVLGVAPFGTDKVTELLLMVFQDLSQSHQAS